MKIQYILSLISERSDKFHQITTENSIYTSEPLVQSCKHSAALHYTRNNTNPEKKII